MAGTSHQHPFFLSFFGLKNDWFCSIGHYCRIMLAYCSLFAINRLFIEKVWSWFGRWCGLIQLQSLMENKGFLSLLSSRTHLSTPFLSLPFGLWNHFYLPPISWSEHRGSLEQLCSLIPAAVIVDFYLFIYFLNHVRLYVVIFFPCTSPFFFSGLALAIRDQEYHGFLFANISHDGGQLIDVAAVEMLCLPQVQDHRGWAHFGCKETHVSAEKGTQK